MSNNKNINKTDKYKLHKLISQESSSHSIHDLVFPESETTQLMNNEEETYNNNSDSPSSNVATGIATGIATTKHNSNTHNNINNNDSNEESNVNKINKSINHKSPIKTSNSSKSEKNNSEMSYYPTVTINNKSNDSNESNKSNNYKKNNKNSLSSNDNELNETDEIRENVNNILSDQPPQKSNNIDNVRKKYFKTVPSVSQISSHQSSDSPRMGQIPPSVVELQKEYDLDIMDNKEDTTSPPPKRIKTSINQMDNRPKLVVIESNRPLHENPSNNILSPSNINNSSSNESIDNKPIDKIDPDNMYSDKENKNNSNFEDKNQVTKEKQTVSIVELLSHTNPDDIPLSNVGGGDDGDDSSSSSKGDFDTDNDNDDEDEDNSSDSEDSKSSSEGTSFQLWRNLTSSLDTYYDKWKTFLETNACCSKIQSYRDKLRTEIVDTNAFDYFILVFIIANCVFIAMDDPKSNGAIVQRSELPFTTFFTVEMIIKWIAYGLFTKSKKSLNKSSAKSTPLLTPQNKEIDAGTEIEMFSLPNIKLEDHPSGILRYHVSKMESVDATNLRRDARKKRNLQKQLSEIDSGENDSNISKDKVIDINDSNNNSTSQLDDIDIDDYVGYFREGWNVLDFIIVVSSWFSFLPDGGNYTSIRVLRVLRPLRTVTRVKELKLLIETILKSLRGLVDVLILLMFLFVTFAIIGLQLFRGALHRQCFSRNYDAMKSVDRETWLHSNTSDEYWLADTHYCREEHRNTISSDCPELYPYCLEIAPNPDGHVTSFDNFAAALLQVFVTITLEGWVAIMYRIQKSVNPLSFMYFVLLTFVVGFFAVNLCLAVIEDVYSQLNDSGSDDDDDDDEETKKDRQRLHEQYKMPDFTDDFKNETSIKELPIQSTITHEKNVDSNNSTARNSFTRSKQINRKEGETMHKSKTLPNRSSISSRVAASTWLESYRSGKTAKRPTSPFNNLSPSINNTKSNLNEDRNKIPLPINLPFSHSKSVPPNDDYNNTNKEDASISSQKEKQVLRKTKSMSLYKPNHLELKKIKNENDLNENNNDNNSNNNNNNNNKLDRTSSHLMKGFNLFHKTPSIANVDESKKKTRHDKSKLSTDIVGSVLVNAGNKSINEFGRSISNMNRRMQSSVGRVQILDGVFVTQDTTKAQEEARKEKQEHEVMARKALRLANEKPNEYLKDKPDWIISINKLVTHKRFERFVMLIIILNTIVLALEWPNMSEKLSETLENINLSFTLFFLVELILKMIGLGYKVYFSDRWNVFDFIIVVISVIELPFSKSSGFSALRAFRLLRVFRLLGKYENMRLLLGMVLESLDEVAWLTVILLIFMFMFSTLAMSSFGRQFSELEDPSGRWRFDNFYWAMISVFQVVSGDAWNEVMYDAVRASSYGAILYFVTVVCFGTFIVLNLFVAILLSQMGTDDAQSKYQLEDAVSYAKQLNEMLEQHNNNNINNNNNISKEEEKKEMEEQFVARLVMRMERTKYLKEYKKNQREWKHLRNKEKMEGVSLGIFTPESTVRKFLHKLVSFRQFDFVIDILILINCGFLAAEEPNVAGKSHFRTADIFFTTIFVSEMIIKIIAFGCFPQPFRNKRVWNNKVDDDELVEWTEKCWESIVSMHDQKPREILEVPGLAIKVKESNDGFHIVHLWGAQVLRIVYCKKEFYTCYILKNDLDGDWQCWDPVEEVDEDIITICKSFDMTDYHHNAYLASNWNRLDAFVVLVAIIGVGLPDIAFLRAIRAFRPFRIMVRIDQIKVVLGALVRAIPAMINVMIFCILFWFVLAILGVNRWSGKFSECVVINEDSQWTEESVISLNRTQCNLIYKANQTVQWRNAAFNFDHVFEAVHSLFVVATLSGWNEVMYRAVDATPSDKAPIKNAHPMNGIYFVVVVVLCSFFSLNLIVSVVVDNFNRIKAEKDGSAFQTKEQREWVRNKSLLARIALNPAPPPPQNTFRKKCFKLIENPRFEIFILSCIIFNAVTMSCEHYNQSKSWSVSLNVFDILFVSIFVIEVLLKMSGYGPKLYFKDHWNKFDFIISIVGVIGWVTNAGIGLNVVRLFRVGRVLRLIHKAKTLKMLFWTLIESIPSLWNIGMLLFVIFFIYAVIGMNLFGLVDHELKNEVNFDSFTNSLDALYRVGTEDGWTDVYESYITAYRYTQKNGEYYLRSKIYQVYFYFISFFVFGTLVLINLFIAVVLDSFQDNADALSREDKLTPVKVWRDIWLWFDPLASEKISAKDFITILKITPHPAGFASRNPFVLLMEAHKKMKSVTARSRRSSKHLTAQSKKIDTLHLNEIDEIKEENNNRIRSINNNSSNNSNNSNNDNSFEDDEYNNEHHLSYLLSRKLLTKIKPQNRIEYLSGLVQAQVTHTEMLQFLMTLKLLVHKNNGDLPSDCDYYVKYDEALICLCGEVVGPKLPEDANNQHTNEKQRIEDWYAQVSNKVDLLNRLRDEKEKNRQYYDQLPSNLNKEKLSKIRKRVLTNIQQRRKNTIDQETPTATALPDNNNNNMSIHSFKVIISNNSNSNSHSESNFNNSNSLTDINDSSGINSNSSSNSSSNNSSSESET